MSIINELVNERVNQESKVLQEQLTEMLVQACLPYMDLFFGEDFNNTNDKQMEDKKMAKVNLTMEQQIEALKEAGCFEFNETSAPEEVAEAYTEMQEEAKLTEGIDDPGCTEKQEEVKMLEEIREKEREEFKTMTLEQLVENKAITKARIKEELAFLEVKSGSKLSREELISIWFNKMHESKAVVGEVKEVTNTPKEEQTVPPTPENVVIPPEPKQEETIQSDTIIPPTQEPVSQQEVPESKPVKDKPTKEWKVKKAESDEDVFGYILWKNRVDEKLYSKAWVGAKNINWYIKQKYLGKPTWKGCTFTEEEEGLVQKYIERCVRNKWIKPVYKGEKLSGYFISPEWVAWYYLGLEMDVVYEAENVLYVIDYSCKYRFEFATGEPVEITKGIWEYMINKGKFIGTITRDNAQTFTKFEVPSSTNNTPPAPVVPQQ